MDISWWFDNRAVNCLSVCCGGRGPGGHEVKPVVDREAEELVGLREVKPEQKSALTQISLPSWALHQTWNILPVKGKNKQQETVVNSHQYEINFYWRYWFFFTLFLSPPPHVSQRGVLLFSSVLIYLSSLALGTLISCLLSFLLTVCVTPTSQVIFLPLMSTNSHEWQSAGVTAAAPRCAQAAALLCGPARLCHISQAQPAVEPAYLATASVASGLPTLWAQRN